MLLLQCRGRWGDAAVGSAADIWDSFRSFPQTIQTAPSQRLAPVGAVPKLHLFTFDSDPSPNCALACNAKFQGLRLNVLGLDYKKHSPFMFGQRLCFDCGEEDLTFVKLRYMQAVVENLELTGKKVGERISENDLILFVDSFDVLLQKSAEEMVAMYLEKAPEQNQIIFNSEVCCFPLANKEFTRREGTSSHCAGWGMASDKMFFDPTSNSYLQGKELCSFFQARAGPGRHKFLNSGVYMGPARLVRELLREVDRILSTRFAVSAKSSRANEPGNSGKFDQLLVQLVQVEAPRIGITVNDDASVFMRLQQPSDADDFERPLCEPGHFRDGTPPAFIKYVQLCCGPNCIFCL